MNQNRPGELTDPKFWDSFWRDVTIPDMVDETSSFDRAFRDVLCRHLSGAPGGALVEIGCAPGRWLAYCSNELGYDVTGYDSSPTGAAKTRENLAYQSVPAEVIEQDFMSDRERVGKFDVVMSMGLIEHFVDPTDVIRQHALLARPGGLVILEVPNLRGITLRLLKRTASPLLAYHNLDVMAVDALRGLAQRVGLDVTEIAYIGGFEPQFIDAAASGPVFKTLYRVGATTRRRLRVLDRVNSRHFSGYLCGVFKKPLSAAS